MHSVLASPCVRNEDSFRSAEQVCHMFREALKFHVSAIYEHDVHSIKPPVDGANESAMSDNPQGAGTLQEGTSASPSNSQVPAQLPPSNDAQQGEAQPQPAQSKREEKGDDGEESIITKGQEVILQGFNWESHKSAWWAMLQQKVQEIADAGITVVWLPPATDSLAPQGYLPRDLYSLNTAYGSEEELRTLVQSLRSLNVHAMADVVINHRTGSTQGEGGLYNRYDGMAMPWDESAVVAECGGKGNSGTGEKFDGAPNIDHTQEHVRSDLASWMRWLRSDVGFSAFRFDYAKGYSPKYVQEYIKAAKPQFAVGEFWDACNYSGTDYDFDYDQDTHRQRIVDWIDGTGGLAAAFDFSTKGILQEAAAKGEWWRLKDAQGRPSGLIGLWPSRTVTFIENHDTGSTQAHWPFPKEHILKGYAYILTHPGQPTVFYDHLFDWDESVRKGIKELISVRKCAGIHSRSKVQILEANESVYVAKVGEMLTIKIGDGDWSPSGDDSSLQESSSGDGYCVWLLVT